MENWKDLWNKNYRSEGDCAGLDKFVKGLDFGAKKDASYLPWAVVERIFKLQDGEIEIVKENGTIVEADRFLIREEVDEETGAVREIYNFGFFINIIAKWQGRTYVERYPLQDSNGRPLSSWTQNDLNKSMQRGKTKAIACISGIGYKLYEDGDLQFDGNDKEEKQERKQVEKVKKAIEKIEKQKPVEEVKENEKTSDPQKEDLIAVNEVEEKINTADKSELTTITIPENKIDIENALKDIFITGGAEKSQTIKSFLKARNLTKFSELSDEEIRELYILVA